MDSTPEDRLAGRLKSLPLPAYRYYEQAGSTNDVALTWLEEGAPDGALVVANQQTAGRGRLARRWVTRPNAALAFSLVVRPSTQEAGRLPLFSLLAGLAVQQALSGQFGLPAEIKWPNDILVRGKKVAGILAEAGWQGEHPLGLVIGIGINIAAAAVPPPDELRFPAGALEDFLSPPPDRWAVLEAVLERFMRLRAGLVEAAFLSKVERRLAYRGCRVRVETGTEHALTGIIQGMEPDGGLRLLLEDNQVVRVTAGEVSLRPVEDKN